MSLSALALVLLLVTPWVAAEAQQSARIPQVGILRTGSPPDDYVEIFRMALRQLGYGEGQTIVVVPRWAEGKQERLQALATELVRRKVDVIVASQTPAAVAAKQATNAIPIVIAGADPVATGLVASLARPGQNITGLTLVLPDLDAKRVEAPGSCP